MVWGSCLSDGVWGVADQVVWCGGLACQLVCCGVVVVLPLAVLCLAYLTVVAEG